MPPDLDTKPTEPGRYSLHATMFSRVPAVSPILKAPACIAKKLSALPEIDTYPKALIFVAPAGCWYVQESTVWNWDTESRSLLVGPVSLPLPSPSQNNPYRYRRQHNEHAWTCFVMRTVPSAHCCAEQSGLQLYGFLCMIIFCRLLCCQHSRSAVSSLCTCRLCSADST